MSRGSSDIIQPLNPADCFTLAMDEQIRLENMPGSLCGFALELDKIPDIQWLSERIEALTRHFPVVLSSLQQHGRRFYWCRRQHPGQIFFQHYLPAASSADPLLDFIRSNINSPAASRESINPLEFHLLSDGRQHIFFMRWLHPLCDARGADLILKYLNTSDRGQQQLFASPDVEEALVNVRLRKFSLWQKIKLFVKAKRHIEELDRYRSIVPVQRRQAPERLNFVTRRFSPEQTQTINKLARRQTGLTGTSLYYIGCLMRALDSISPQPEGDAYCVPYAFNLRKQKALTPVLGNHICPLFAQVPKQLLTDRQQLFQHLKKQNALVIRQQLDYAFLPVMWAASWLSLRKHGEQLRKSYRHGTERSSFWFSDIGQPDGAAEDFCQAGVTGMFHICQISSPPALALLTCQYKQQLTLTYNFIEPLYDEAWLDTLHSAMKRELLDENKD